MDKTTAAIIGLGILALAFISFFAVFRKSGKGKINGPFGTGLEVEGSNEPQQTQIKEVEAGGNIHINEAGGRGVEAYKLKAGGDVVIGSMTTVMANPARAEIEKLTEERNAVHVITLKEIIERIKAAPPFQQNDVRQYYVGLMVDWDTKLLSVDKADGDDLNVYLSVVDKYDPHFSGFCTFNVPSIKYPELKVLHKDHPIRVRGGIAKISDGDIAYIKEPALLFLPQQKNN